MFGTGIAFRLQTFVPEWSTGLINGFDLEFWSGATSLEHFGVELYVCRGSVTVRLHHIGPEGTDIGFAVLSCDGPASVYTRPIRVDEAQGLLLPVIEYASEDAEFDLYFGTNQPPLNPKLRVVIVSGALGNEQQTMREAYATYREHLARQSGIKSALLAYTIPIAPPESVSQMVEVRDNEIALPGFAPDRDVSPGQALFGLTYGAGAHVGAEIDWYGIIDASTPQHPDVFIRMLAALAYLIDDSCHLSAPLPGTLHQVTDGGALMRESGDDLPDWGCFCVSAQDLVRTGLPNPGPGATGPYSLRLAACGSHQIQNNSLHPGTGLDPRAQIWRDPERFTDAYFKAVESDLKARNYVSAERRLEEMDRCLGQVNLQSFRFPLPTRLRRHLRWQRNALNSKGRRAAVYAGQHSLLTWSGRCGMHAAGLQENMARAQLIRKGCQDKRISELERQILALESDRLLSRDRVVADLERANQVTLSLLRQRHAGQRIFVIGNGPSLTIADLDRLKSEITFASNKIYLAYDETDWRPTYYSVEDHLVMQHNRDKILQLSDSIKIFPGNLRDFGLHAPDILFVPFKPPRSFDDPLSDPNFPDFSRDLSHQICWGSSIVYSQIQMAAYMGAAEIVLIGIDHTYTLPPRKEGNRYFDSGEKNHFHPNYREPGEEWHQPNLDVLEVSFAKARKACEEAGIRIVNASRRTHLEVFDRVDFDKLFS